MKEYNKNVTWPVLGVKRNRAFYIGRGISGFRPRLVSPQKKYRKTKHVAVTYSALIIFTASFRIFCA
jgi:hypothetical protein